MADQPTSAAQRPAPLGSLVASATRLTRKNISRFGKGKDTDWQDEVIDLYRSVGEQRFLGSTLANRMGQVKIFIGKLSENPLDDPEPLERPDPVDEAEDNAEPAEPLSANDEAALALWESFASNPARLSQIQTRCGLNLFSTGDGWLVGIPKAMLDSAEQNPEQSGGLILAPAPVAPRLVDRQAPSAQSVSGLSLDDLDWRYLSVKECKIDPQGGKVTIRLQDGSGDKATIEANPDDLFMIRIWRPDPFEWWQADSPTRSSLPVLRELVGLTMGISAQIDSRLAGAGMLLIPQSASDAVKSQLPNAETDSDTDPFAQSLMTVMMAAIQNQASAAAKVPIMPVVPDASIKEFRFISFATPLDAEARPMREEAIRRLALGQDCPPELLLGVGNMNHWGAWLVQEDTITTHIEPPSALFVDALTTQLIWPVLVDQGMSEEEAHQYVVWYSVDHMIVRPNRFDDAMKAYGVEEMSGDSLRKYGGFTDEDAPDGGPDEAFAMVLQLVHRAPALAVTPGIPALVEQIRAVIAGQEPTPGTPEQAQAADSPDGVPAASEDTSGGTQGPPETQSGPATPSDGSETGPPGLAASAIRPGETYVVTDGGPEPVSEWPWADQSRDQEAERV